MTNTQNATSNYGKLLWADLFTSHLATTKTFYENLLGWNLEEQKNTGGTYAFFKYKDSAVCGVSEAPLAELNNKIVAYIGVENLQETIQVIQANGGVILAEPTQMDGIGTWVYAKDPYGAYFSAFQSATQPTCDQAYTFGSQNHLCWHELMSANHNDSLAFYKTVFGWTPSESIDMGPMGVYQMYQTTSGETLGGMMTNTPEMPQVTYWIEYIHVDNVDATSAKAIAQGAKPTFPTMNVGNNTGRIAGFVDPNGLAFAIYQNLKA